MTAHRRLQGSFRTDGLLAVFLGLLMSLPALASTTKPKTPAPVDNRILVTAVDLANQQITFTYQDNKKRLVYVVDPMTSVTVQGQKAALKDIKVGEQVYDYVERDSQSLDSINVATAGAPPAGTTKKK